MKIICIGRNYAKHAKEMNAAVPTEPIFFMKADTAILRGSNFYYPDFTSDLHYEVELVLKIIKVGKNITLEHADTYFDQIGLGIDFTARDLQQVCKEKGQPWEKAKSFDNSAVLSQHFIDKSELEEKNTSFSLNLNGKEVQVGNTADLLFNFKEIISYISQFLTLKTGDLIYTGTPEGVGPVSIGDRLEGFIESKSMFKINIK